MQHANLLRKRRYDRHRSCDGDAWGQKDNPQCEVLERVFRKHGFRLGYDLGQTLFTKIEGLMGTHKNED